MAGTQMQMTLKTLHELPSGWLIYLEDYRKVRNRWFIGTPTPNQPDTCKCIVMAGETNDGTKIASELLIFTSDIFTPMPPQDLVKYLNHLTDAGTEFLKNLSHIDIK